MNNKYLPIRNSKMELNEVYFWTDTIKDWKNLLARDEYKHIIIEQLQWLKQRNKIDIFAYVIMPNHLHFIWQMNEKNGKEMPHASFNKWTSSQFLKNLRTNHPQIIPYFEEKTKERNHRFWIRDPLAVLMDTKVKIEQKIDYIHLNPLGEKWNLVEKPEEYEWSSASFYRNGIDRFGILTHYGEVF
jgi:putative transposase